MKITYAWRELTDDGLLKSPKKLGPYYNESDVNGYNGFDTEDEAIASYDRAAKDYGYSAPAELVLVKLYRADRGE